MKHLTLCLSTLALLLSSSSFAQERAAEGPAPAQTDEAIALIRAHDGAQSADDKADKARAKRAKAAEQQRRKSETVKSKRTKAAKTQKVTRGKKTAAKPQASGKGDRFQRLFKFADLDGNGKISKSEALTARQKLTGLSGQHGATDDSKRDAAPQRARSTKRPERQGVREKIQQRMRERRAAIGERARTVAKRAQSRVKQAKSRVNKAQPKRAAQGRRGAKAQRGAKSRRPVNGKRSNARRPQRSHRGR